MILMARRINAAQISESKGSKGVSLLVPRNRLVLYGTNVLGWIGVITNADEEHPQVHDSYIVHGVRAIIEKSSPL